MSDLIQPERLSIAELREAIQIIARLRESLSGRFSDDEIKRLGSLLRSEGAGSPVRDKHGLPFLLMTMRTASLFADTVEPDHNILTAILLFPLCHLKQELGSRASAI